MRHLPIDGDFIDELFDVLFCKPPNSCVFHCRVASAVGASVLLSYRKKVWIIESDKHSVVFDGIDTWDLGVGLVFRNYNFSEDYKELPTKIPKIWDHINHGDSLDYLLIRNYTNINNLSIKTLTRS